MPKLSDPEIVCSFMGRWQLLYSTADGAEWWGPGVLTLDRLYEVEARLTNDQWGSYVDALIDLMPQFPRRGEIIHASAEQKITALAAVLRPEVEGR